jgi:serine/threonine-protein kinase
MRALQREPGDRFPDAGSFAEALRLWQGDPSAAAAAMAGMPAVSDAAADEGAPPPPSGEPTVYVPPRVTMPADRAARGGPPPGRRPTPAHPRDEGMPWWTWLLIALAVLLLGLIGFLGMQVLGNLTPGATPSPSTASFALPDYKDDVIAAARRDAESHGLVVSRVDRQPSDRVQEGHVISTTPPAGTQVKAGDIIVFTVSSGPDTVPVPRLIGQTEQQAVDTLRSVGLAVGNVSHEPNAAPEGRVIASDPSEGVDWKVGDQVDLVLSSGPTPAPATPTPPPPTPSPTPAAPSATPTGTP